MYVYPLFKLAAAANGPILSRIPQFAQAPHLLFYPIEVAFYDRLG